MSSVDDGSGSECGADVGVLQLLLGGLTTHAPTSAQGVEQLLSRPLQRLQLHDSGGGGAPSSGSSSSASASFRLYPTHGSSSSATTTGATGATPAFTLAGGGGGAFRPGHHRRPAPYPVALHRHLAPQPQQQQPKADAPAETQYKRVPRMRSTSAPTLSLTTTTRIWDLSDSDSTITTIPGTPRPPSTTHFTSPRLQSRLVRALTLTISDRSHVRVLALEALSRSRDSHHRYGRGNLSTPRGVRGVGSEISLWRSSGASRGSNADVGRRAIDFSLPPCMPWLLDEVRPIVELVDEDDAVTGDNQGTARAREMVSVQMDSAMMGIDETMPYIK